MDLRQDWLHVRLELFPWRPHEEHHPGDFSVVCRIIVEQYEKEKGRRKGEQQRCMQNTTDGIGSEKDDMLGFRVWTKHPHRGGEK